jgi:ADP-ribosylglycohydrolase
MARSCCGARARGLAELVYGAISADGDTDSTASMVAAMAVLASGGTIEMPADCELVAQIDELRCLAGDFARAATRITSAGGKG